MIDWKVKKGTMEGKYFLVFICENKDAVNRLSWGIEKYMIEYESHMKRFEEEIRQQEDKERIAKDEEKELKEK